MCSCIIRFQTNSRKTTLCDCLIRGSVAQPTCDKTERNDSLDAQYRALKSSWDLLTLANAQRLEWERHYEIHFLETIFFFSKFVPKSPIENMLALVHVTTRCEQSKSHSWSNGFPVTWRHVSSQGHSQLDHIAGIQFWKETFAGLEISCW